MPSKKKIAILAGAALLVAGAVATVAAQGHRRFGGEHHGPGAPFGADGPAGFGDGMGERMRGGGWFGRGPLTKADFDTRTRERFAALDKNSDGVIDLAEIEASFTERMAGRMQQAGFKPGEMGARMLRRFDTNKDGRVTKDEFLAEVRRNFAEMDLNNDGRITDDDLPPMLRGRGVLTGGPGPGAGGGMMGGGRGGMGPMAWLRDADANKDGIITLDEVLAAAEKRFVTMDRTKDGVVDAADFAALRKETVDYRVKRFIHHFGADKDNRVTREQFAAKAAERFARMDFDNNGVIDRSEQPGGMMRHGWRGGERGPGHGHGGPGGPGGERGPGAGQGPGPGPGPAPERK
ncbi:MAG: EF-hand domain-containing protein [Hyphomicrobiaceae bacterium]